MIELRSRCVGDAELLEMIRWVRDNCKYRVLFSGAGLHKPEAYLEKVTSWALDVEAGQTVRFGSQKDAMLFKMKWC